MPSSLESPPFCLADLHPSQTARVLQVEGADEHLVRLCEMGFVPGSPVRLIKRAPGGDPLEVEIRGYHLSLRHSEAKRIHIEVLATGAAIS